MTERPDFDPANLAENGIMISSALIRAQLRDDQEEVTVMTHTLAKEAPRWVLLNAITGLTVAAAEALQARARSKDEIITYLAKLEEDAKWIGLTRRSDEDPPFM